jgi:hypothetical protein
LTIFVYFLEPTEEHEKGVKESWKESILKILIAPSLDILNEIRWPDWDHFTTYADDFSQMLYALIDYSKNYSIMLVLIIVSIGTFIGGYVHVFAQQQYLGKLKWALSILIVLAILSIISNPIYYYQSIPNIIPVTSYSDASKATANQYTLLSEQALDLEKLFQKSQYNSKLILEQLSFISKQIKEQQSQLNYQREDYRRIWDALYTQNQYMLSVSNDIKLDVIEALQDNTVAVFHKRNEELKVSPEFLEYMKTANFIQAFIGHNKQTIRSFIQDELRYFFLTHKDKTSSIVEKVEQIPSSLEQLVQTTLKKYHQDDNEPDFALRSRGGAIVLSKTSKTYRPPTTSRSLLLRALGYYPMVKSPWAVIRPSIQVGECWSMNGSNGTIAISLSANIFMKTMTLEHPSVNTLLNDIISAPKVFKVFGSRNDLFDLQEKPLFLGEFEYNIHSEYKAQKFLLKESDRAFNTATIRFMSNWGNPNFTDIYRIKISGKPVT